MPAHRKSERGHDAASAAALAVLLTVLSVVLSAGLPAGPASAAPPQVTLAPQPSTQRNLDLVERWRIGGEDDQDILLGLVQSGVVDAQGNVYLVDRQLSQVLVISPQGQLKTTLGRAGEGPGELTRPHAVVLLEGGKVGVIQGFPGRITILNPDGTPGGDVTIGGEANHGGFNFLREMKVADGKFLGVKGRNTFDMQTQKSQTVSTLSLLDLSGTEVREFLSHEDANDLANPSFDEGASFSELSTWDVGPDGRLYTVPQREAYTINVRDLQGEILRTYTREFSARTRSQEDRDRVNSGMMMVVNGRRIVPESKTMDRDPAIVDLNVAADGRLFVTNCRQQSRLLPPDCAARFDVISPEGVLLEELTLRIPGFDPEADNLVFLDGTLFLHLRNVEDARQAMLASFGGGEDGDEDADLSEPQPLEVVLYAMP